MEGPGYDRVLLVDFPQVISKYGACKEVIGRGPKDPGATLRTERGREGEAVTSWPVALRQNGG